MNVSSSATLSRVVYIYRGKQRVNKWRILSACVSLPSSLRCSSMAQVSASASCSSSRLDDHSSAPFVCVLSSSVRLSVSSSLSIPLSLCSGSCALVFTLFPSSPLSQCLSDSPCCLPSSITTAEQVEEGEDVLYSGGILQRYARRFSTEFHKPF